MTDRTLYLDIETRSQTDLLTHGLRRYAECPTTQLICIGWAFDDEEEQDWFPEDGEPFPREIAEHFEAGGVTWAHNAAFERHLFEWVICPDFDVTPLPTTSWRCSMIAATTSGYPAGLDAAAEALGADLRKHPEGTRLIRLYCAPGFSTEWMFNDRQLMSDYVKDDVATMRAIIPCFRQLTDFEWEQYALNEKLNDRGIKVDLDLCRAAQGYADELAEDANARLAEITGGMMTKHTQRKGRDAWLFPRLTSYQMKLLEVYRKGEKKLSLDEDHRGFLLECDDLDDDARQLLEAINDAGSSALKKYSVAASQHVEGVVHNSIQFNGAQTGRFTGRVIQPHNFKKDRQDTPLADLEGIIAVIKARRPLDSPNFDMGRVMRGMVYDPAGLAFVDWSQIEARVAPWLAVKPSGESKLDVFRSGRDIYTVAAAAMFGWQEDEVTKNLRQTGKIAELSLQFGGGAGALQGMARNYGQAFEEEEAQDVVYKWRNANPWAGEIWQDYDRAIDNAVCSPGEEFECGRVSFLSDGANYLWCVLPSGRYLAYPKPRIETYETPWGEERVGPTFQTHFKPAAGQPPLRRYARGALLFQNTVQAVAADILREALVEADEMGLEVALHVHDEIVVYGGEKEGEMLNECMLAQPWWADGLPIETGGVQTGTRWLEAH
jgi:DNA polymerase